MFCRSFGSEIIDSGNVPTNLTRVETFPGAACLKPFAVLHAFGLNIARFPWGKVQSGSPPTTSFAPLKKLGHSLDEAACNVLLGSS